MAIKCYSVREMLGRTPIIPIHCTNNKKTQNLVWLKSDGDAVTRARCNHILTQEIIFSLHHSKTLYNNYCIVLYCCITIIQCLCHH